MIELVLVEVGFDRKKDLPRIYFGNWPRDFSQIIDLAVVRPTDHLMSGPISEINNWVDNSQIDAVFARPPIFQQLEINQKTGLKNYIVLIVTIQK